MKKWKIVLGVLLAVTAIMLVLSYAFVLNISDGIQESTDDELTAAVSIFVLTIIGLLAGIPWILTSLVYLIFTPIVLCAKTEQKLEKRVKILLIFTVILSVAVIFTMGLCWTFAGYSTPLVVVMIFTDLCYLACFVITCLLYSKLRKLRKNTPTEQIVGEQATEE